MANLVQFPITEELSAAGDGGEPLVVADPAGPVAQAFGELGAAVVREIAKLSRAAKNSVRFDAELRALVVRLPAQGTVDGVLPSPCMRLQLALCAVPASAACPVRCDLSRPRCSFGPTHRLQAMKRGSAISLSYRRVPREFSNSASIAASPAA